ncbi:MAG: UDP-3-O-[3-hydroxymyristoyl] glucosamine N-acyltransferase [Hyphomicrobiaceae bacterium]|jgi:UDP-3-O-[3-hydroxymyristoyl] glucosamine N-acyltransferase
MRLAELAEILGARLEGDPEVQIQGLAPIDEAGDGDLSFVASPKYRRLIETTGASAVIVSENEKGQPRNALRVPEPYAAFVQALRIFDRRPVPAPGVHPTAVMADTASVGAGAYIGPYAVIGERVRIGDGACIHPHVVIYPDVTIGQRFVAHAGAVVRECVELGDDVVLQPGAIVGADGFGFLPTGDRPTAIPQIGGVLFGDGVEIGANTTIDRAAIGQTRLANGVKLDNLVMVAHGSRIGAGTMIAAQAGVAGSTTLGARVMVGGQAGFAGHITVGDGTQVAGGSGVMGDQEAGQVIGGTPAVDIRIWRRYAVALARLPEIIRRLASVERRLGASDSDDSDDSDDREKPES